MQDGGDVPFPLGEMRERERQNVTQRNEGEREQMDKNGSGVGIRCSRVDPTSDIFTHPDARTEALSLFVTLWEGGTMDPTNNSGG
jgi:hypothetical protein